MDTKKYTFELLKVKPLSGVNKKKTDRPIAGAAGLFKPIKKKMGGLTGGQKKLDVNKDGKISGEDFKMLRGSKKEMRMGGVVGFKETESRKTPLKKAEPKNKPLGPTLGKPVGKKGGK